MVSPTPLVFGEAPHPGMSASTKHPACARRGPSRAVGQPQPPHQDPAPSAQCQQPRLACQGFRTFDGGQRRRQNHRTVYNYEENAGFKKLRKLRKKYAEKTTTKMVKNGENGNGEKQES